MLGTKKYKLMIKVELILSKEKKKSQFNYKTEFNINESLMMELELLKTKSQTINPSRYVCKFFFLNGNDI